MGVAFSWALRVGIGLVRDFLGYMADGRMARRDVVLFGVCGEWNFESGLDLLIEDGGSIRIKNEFLILERRTKNETNDMMF